MSDETESTDSPEVALKRRELFFLTTAFTILGEANIRAKQAREAQDILGFMDGLVIKAQDALNSQIASEELGQPMKMDGAKLSIAKDEAH